jgi:hypothetical protein
MAAVSIYVLTGDRIHSILADLIPHAAALQVTRRITQGRRRSPRAGSRCSRSGPPPYAPRWTSTPTQGQGVTLVQAVGLVPHRKLIMGEHNIKVGQSSLIRLVFWVELGPTSCCCGLYQTWAVETPAHGYKFPGRIPLRPEFDVWRGRLFVGLVPHRKLIVGEHNPSG